MTPRNETPIAPLKSCGPTAVDFRILQPLDSWRRLFLIFVIVIRLERASLPLGEDREAGENPALPRNCKRGNCHRPLGEIPGRARVLRDGNELHSYPYSRSQETGAIRLLQPLSRAKEDSMRVFVGVF